MPSLDQHTWTLRDGGADAEDAKPLLRVWPSEVPTGVGCMKQFKLVNGGLTEKVEMLTGICPVVRFDSARFFFA